MPSAAWVTALRESSGGGESDSSLKVTRLGPDLFLCLADTVPARAAPPPPFIQTAPFEVMVRVQVGSRPVRSPARRQTASSVGSGSGQVGSGRVGSVHGGPRSAPIAPAAHPSPSPPPLQRQCRGQHRTAKLPAQTASPTDRDDAMEPILKYSLLVAVGLVVVAVGLVMGWYGFPVIVDNMIDQEMVLTPSSKSFDPWQSPTSEVDVYMQFILFSVNNSKDVIAGGKPIVHELGPFSYKENRQRVNLSWSDDGTELTYNEVITYHFDEISSGEGLSEDTNITTINAPMVVVASMSDTLPALARNMLYNIINSEEEGHTFVTYKAGELLMTGVEDKLFTYVAKYFPSMLPPTFADGKFRLYAYNNTVDGPYTILTGKTNMDEFTFIQSYQNEDHLSYWNDTYCDMLNGTDGITFPDNIGDVNRIYIFNKDMCRSIYLDYENDVQYFGITGRRFTPPRNMLENITVNPDNQCFCVPAGNCLDTGVMSLSPCQYGAPIVASQPHFYNGAQQYVDDVIGLSPNKNLHETFIDLEPVTGLTLNGAKKIQINMQLKRYPKVHGLENIREILFPIVYTNETATIDQAGADDFNQQVGLPLKLLKAAQWVMIASGGVIMVVALLLYWRSSSRVTTV